MITTLNEWKKNKLNEDSESYPKVYEAIQFVDDTMIINACDSTIVELNKLQTLLYNAIQPPNDQQNGEFIPWPKSREEIQSVVEFIDKIRARFK